MKKALWMFVLLLGSAATFAQSEQPVVTTKKLKMVFQLTTNDTLAQKSLVKQLGHALAAAPNAKIEVVCHNNGISFLQSAVTRQADKIRELSEKGIVFVACENTMRDRKIKREELLPVCGTVPSGVIELALKQDKGWAYIKAGF